MIPFLTGVLQKPNYTVGDKVYWQNGTSREGPYVIATVTSGKCTLCLEDGATVNNGGEIDEEYLEAA